jgi:DNA-binding transcriptional regulator LsrR (DeoR family)
VGSGERRLNSVKGALMTGIVTHLVSDEQTAKELVE